MLFDKKFDLAFGIGQACACTRILRRAHLQYYSYPYDWLAGSAITKRAEIIADDYRGLIDYDDLELSESNNVAENRAIYINKSNGLIYNHDFKLDKTLEETYPAVREKYDRRIKRQLEQIAQSKKILVSYIQMPNNPEVVEDKTVIEAHEILQKRFSKQEITLLYLTCEHGKNDYELKEIAKNVIRTSFDYDAYLEKTPFLVNERRLERLFCKIMISTKFMNTENLVKRVLYRIKCFFRGRLF